jgi:hypothetical protein
LKILLILILCLLIIIPFSFGLEECSRHGQLTEDVPCRVISSWKPDTGCDEPVYIYQENGTIVQTQQWNDSIPFCSFNWNITTPITTYVYNSSIEDGVITLEKQDNMLSIILLQMFLIAFFILAGLPHKVGLVKFFSWSMAMIQLGMAVWMVYINEAGGEIVGLLYLNTLITLIIGGIIGLFTLVVIQIKLVSLDKNSGLNDDGYTKFVFGGK